VSLCLQHFSKLKHSRYDFYRASSLLEVLGAAVSTRILALLKEKSIMQCSFEDFRRVKNHSEEVFSAWDTHLASQRSMLKDVAKRRNITKQKNFRFDLDILQQRLKEVFEFREQHERLLNVFLQVLSGQEGTVISDLNEAYALVLRSENDVLDITPAGTVAWKNSRQLYERRLEKTEDHISKLLEEQLSAASTSDDMFHVFSTFNPLFFRPAIRAAVNSFRTVLLKNVREDVKRLQEKFRLRYDDSLERASADLRDIPPLCGRIIWARQIENQLATLMKRMEDVLGLAWEDHFEGKQLKEVCDELKNYLDTNQLYTDWLNLQLESNMQKYSKLKDFLLLVEDDPRTSQKILKVNFDEKQVIVFKEVGYLEWLLPGMTTAHKTIPTTIRSQSKESYTRYPIAMALQAALSGFYQANSGINDGNSLLLVSHVQVVRELIKEALGGSKRSRKWIKWDSNDLSDWVGQLSNKVFALEERVVDVNETLKSVDDLLLLLKSCPYDRNKFEEILLQLQGIVDNLQIRGFSNIHVWISNLDDKIENILTDRLKSACVVWLSAFNSDDDNNDINNEQVNCLTLDQTVHEILLSNQMLYLSPPIEQARTEWIANFHNFITIIVTLPRIVGSRFKVFENTNDDSIDYSSILLKLGSDVVRPPFVAIENKLALANDYIQSWLQYQALWDANVATVAEKIGHDLIKWQQLLNEIKFARNTIDSVDDEKLFGPIIINHRQVQNKVNLKYDTWQKDLQARFGNILLDVIKSTHTDLVTCKTRLESIYLEGLTKDVIMGVEFILKTRSSMKERKELVGNLESSEKLLQKQRYQFPNDWLSVVNVTSSLKDLIQIFDRRVAAMDIQLSLLQSKIREEDKDISVRTDELLSNWEKTRPIVGGKIPSEMIQNLSMMTSQVSKLSEDTSRILGAKEALGLEFLPDNRLEYITQEIKDLREVWIAVLPIYDRLQAIRSVLLRDIVPTTNRKDLEALINELKNLSSKVRGYDAVEFIKDELTKYNNVFPLLKDLCSETLKDRHWKLLLTSMGIKQTYISLTVGALWDTSPMTYRKSISEILSTAQGELAIEQFLRDIRENWISSELNLVLRDGARLIVGWDILFSTLEDNLNSLASLKQSPYFRNVPEFQEDTVNWELRLTNLRGIFDNWVEVQRKWVYLRGIFKNPDIKAQLPSQFSKFKSVDNEFMALMKKVAAKPLVMDLLQLVTIKLQFFKIFIYYYYD
jgi:dynein heavy chain 1